MCKFLSKIGCVSIKAFALVGVASIVLTVLRIIEARRARNSIVGSTQNPEEGVSEEPKTEQPTESSKSVD